MSIIMFVNEIREHEHIDGSLHKREKRSP